MSGGGHGHGQRGERGKKKIALLIAVLEIGIVLASAGIITGIAALPWISSGLGVVGIVLALIGLLAPQAIHLF
jgi:hypothetical protein